jgi:hypothetical protein
VPTPVHGMFTQATWFACVEAGYLLGLRSQTYLKTDAGRGVCTEGAQTIIRHPAGSRTTHWGPLPPASPDCHLVVIHANSRG